MDTSSAVQLRRTYDTGRLLADLRACEAAYDRWVTHEQVLEGKSSGWEILPLRSRGGDLGEYCARRDQPELFRDTILLEHAPYIREILGGLESTIGSVRLSALRAGGRIYEHSDGPGFGLGEGHEIRLHLPIITSDDVWFVVDGVRYPLRPGELWYGNFSQPHWVENRGAEARIHLMIDTRVSETVLGLFPGEYLAGRSVKADRPACVITPELRAALQISFQLSTANEALDREIARLPPGFQSILRATFGERNELRWIDDRLWAVVRGRPAFLFEVESASRLRVVNQPAILELELEGGVPVQATLELTMLDESFRLPLQVAALS